MLDGRETGLVLVVLDAQAKVVIKSKKVTIPILRRHYVREGKKIAEEWQQE